jgi:uncharacterized protein YjaG (DUF416 family)
MKTLQEIFESIDIKESIATIFKKDIMRSISGKVTEKDQAIRISQIILKTIDTYLSMFLEVKNTNDLIKEIPELRKEIKETQKMLYELK